MTATSPGGTGERPVLLWAWPGGPTASAYLAGYLIERSLSLDNVFVFAVAAHHATRGQRG